MRKLQPILLFLSYGISLVSYSLLPSRIATHWDMAGQPNGYSEKTLGLLLFPFLLTILFLIFTILPKLDPLKKNLVSFQQSFHRFIVVFFLFMIYLQLLVVVWNMGVVFDFIRFLMPAFSVLFFYTGMLLKDTKPNWFIGIRTPWTLSNEIVWSKTHVLGSQLFKAVAVVNLLGVLWPSVAIYLLIGGVLLTVLITTSYSYFIYRKRRISKSN